MWTIGRIDTLLYIGSKMKLHGKRDRSWCSGSSDRCFMVDPFSYYLFQPMLHDWCNKGCGVYYPVCRMLYIKRTLAANQKE